MAKVSFLGGSPAGLPRTLLAAEACLFFSRLEGNCPPQTSRRLWPQTRAGLPRTVLAAEACLFFSRLPKATAPLKLWPQTCNTAAFCRPVRSQQPRHGRKPATQPGQPSGPGCVAVAKVSFLGGPQPGLPRTVLAAEARFFFSRLPKAPAPLKPSSAPLAANLRRSHFARPVRGQQPRHGRKPATQPITGPGCVAVKVSFLGGSRAGLPRTVLAAEARFFFSRLPKATAALKPLAANLQRSLAWQSCCVSLFWLLCFFCHSLGGRRLRHRGRRLSTWAASPQASPGQL